MGSKKNWHIFWRLKIIYIILLISCFSGLFISGSCDKEELLYGRWYLQSSLVNGEPLTDSTQYNILPKYTYYTFFYEQTLTITTYALRIVQNSTEGFYSIKNSTLTMKYTLPPKRYEITAKIKMLTKRELKIEYDYNGNTYLLDFFSN
jgi:hypothetical protein